MKVDEFKELTEYAYIHQKEIFLPKLMKYLEEENWDGFINMALAVYEVMPEAFEYYDQVPNELKYDFVINAYIHHGDSIPKVREAIKTVRQYGKPTLPEEIENQEFVVVYRSGEEEIEESKYRMSWTIDIAIADFFMNTYTNRHANHMYMGKIKPCDIIAFTDERNEKEIIQYGNVYDIEEIQERGSK